VASTQQQRKNEEALQAAYLCAKHDMTQADIGRVLGGLSQSRVSRLLQRAEDLGVLKRTYQFNPDGIPPASIDQLKRLVEPRSLIDVLARIQSPNGVQVRGVYVVDSGGSGTSARAWDMRLSRFGRAAARPLVELMSRSAVFACTWGKTISSLVTNGKREQWQRIAPTIRFVPVCGEPRDHADDRDTSSHLAERLHELVHSTAVLPSLTGVPALIGRRYGETKRRGILRFVEDAGSYREVFGGKAPLIGQVDSLLTAVGPSQRPMGFFFEELLMAGSTASKKLTGQMLEKLVVGDIGGVLIPRRDLDARGSREVKRLTGMWTGVKLHHFQRIARAAARSTRPGVIVAAIGGDDRAEILAEVIRDGLVNELIIDRTLSDALVKRLS
jgi:DNA-binding transcriptional regulator LsrR (DeoR family)